MNLDRSQIAVTSRSFCKNSTLKRELLARYPNVKFNDEGRILDGAELVAFLGGCEKVVSGLEIFNDKVLSQLPGLKVIAKYGVGLDMLDLDALSKHGVKLGWTGGVNRRSVSELTLMFALALLHRVPPAHTELRAKVWRQHIGNLLTGKTFGIIGSGHVGKDLIRLLQPFDCKIQVFDTRRYDEFWSEFKVGFVSLADLLKTSDVISLHVPLDGTTRGMLGPEQLEMMKSNAYLINCARGNLIDEEALYEFLRDRKIAGAAFDVFAVEPAPNQELIDLPYFLCTPHIGGSAEEAMLAMGRAAIDGLEDHLTIEEFRKIYP